MKKILSCVLAIALVFSLMSMTVFADTTEHVVGNGANGSEDNGTYKDGEQSFTDNTSTGKLTVNFTSADNANPANTMEDRYAIDITYSDLIIDLTQMRNATTGDLLEVRYVWDVNTHKYVLVDEGTGDASTTDATNTPIKINSFQVTNHSSQSIYYKTLLTIDAAVTACMTVETDATCNIVTRATTDEGAKLGDQEIITATPESNWLDTINELAASYVTGNQIGTITVTFSMEEITA